MVSGANGRQRERLFHGLGSVLVVLYALFPVAWIVSLSLKRSADLDDRRFVPQSFSMECSPPMPSCAWIFPAGA